MSSLSNGIETTVEYAMPIIQIYTGWGCRGNRCIADTTVYLGILALINMLALVSRFPTITAYEFQCRVRYFVSGCIGFNYFHILDLVWQFIIHDCDMVCGIFVTEYQPAIFPYFPAFSINCPTFERIGLFALPYIVVDRSPILFEYVRECSVIYVVTLPMVLNVRTFG